MQGVAVRGTGRHWLPEPPHMAGGERALLQAARRVRRGVCPQRAPHAGAGPRLRGVPLAAFCLLPAARRQCVVRLLVAVGSQPWRGSPPRTFQGGPPGGAMARAVGAVCPAVTVAGAVRPGPSVLGTHLLPPATHTHTRLLHHTEGMYNVSSVSNTSGSILVYCHDPYTYQWRK